MSKDMNFFWFNLINTIGNSKSKYQHVRGGGLFEGGLLNICSPRVVAYSREGLFEDLRYSFDFFPTKANLEELYTDC